MLQGMVPFPLLSSPTDAPQGQHAPHKQEGLVATSIQDRGGTCPVLTSGPGNTQPLHHPCGFMWVPDGVAPEVGSGAVLRVLQWVEEVPDPVGAGWGVCNRLSTASMPVTGIKAGGIDLGYRKGDAVGCCILHGRSSPWCPAHHHCMAQHSGHTGYWKIEPFFIEK